MIESSSLLYRSEKDTDDEYCKSAEINHIQYLFTTLRFINSHDSTYNQAKEISVKKHRATLYRCRR